MSTEELKEKLQTWVNQVGVYNEGCMCWWCANQIQKNINLILNEYKAAHPENKPKADDSFSVRVNIHENPELTPNS